MSVIYGEIVIFNLESCPNSLKYWHTEPLAVNVGACRGRSCLCKISSMFYFQVCLNFQNVIHLWS